MEYYNIGFYNKEQYMSENDNMLAEDFTSTLVHLRENEKIYNNYDIKEDNAKIYELSSYKFAFFSLFTRNY